MRTSLRMRSTLPPLQRMRQPIRAATSMALRAHALCGDWQLSAFALRLRSRRAPPQRSDNERMATVASRHRLQSRHLGRQPLTYRRGHRQATSRLAPLVPPPQRCSSRERRTSQLLLRALLVRARAPQTQWACAQPPRSSPRRVRRRQMQRMRSAAYAWQTSPIRRTLAAAGSGRRRQTQSPAGLRRTVKTRRRWWWRRRRRSSQASLTRR